MSVTNHIPNIGLKICVVGNMLGQNQGYITTQGQIMANLLTNEGYCVISTSSRVNRVARLADIIGTVIRHRDCIDIIVLEVYSGLYFILADMVSKLGQFLGIPMIFVLHGGNLSVFSTRFQAWVSRVLHRADILVAPSPFLAKGLADLSLPIRTVPNIVEIENYPFRLRRKLNPTLLWMRAFHELYNPTMAVMVLEALRKKHTRASLVMAGGDKGLASEVKKFAEERGLNSAIRFPGFLDQKAKVEEFSKADIYLNTNHIDNMPVSLIEACAMGLPVVATSVGGIPDMITDGRNGLLVRDGDIKGMADALVSLLENAELAERLSINGRKLAEQSSWEIVKQHWEALFDEIMLKQNKHEIVDRTVGKAAAQ